MGWECDGHRMSTLRLSEWHARTEWWVNGGLILGWFWFVLDALLLVDGVYPTRLDGWMAGWLLVDVVDGMADVCCVLCAGGGMCCGGVDAEKCIDVCVCMCVCVCMVNGKRFEVSR